MDIGNTAIKIGYFENEKCLEVFRFERESDWISFFYDKQNIPIIVSSVAHLEEDVRNIFSFMKKLLILNHQIVLPIKNEYATPETLGFDRLAAVVGANGRFPDQNVLVVDIGTALKFDLISKENTFIGGVISLGRQMRFNALHTFTKKLPLLNAVDIPDLVGTSTESCIKSGVMNGMLSEINGMIEKYIETYNPVVLLCGGDASYFETKIKYRTFAAPNLVLEGLNRILLYNVVKD